MADVLLVRADDLVVLGVRWSGFILSGTGQLAILTAGPQARLVITFPPQHIAEETFSSSLPLPPPVPDGAGGTVPVWRGQLSGSSQLAFGVAAGTEIPLSSEGVLAAVINNPVLTAAGVPGPDDTAIELPWRLVIAPQTRSPGGAVVCQHPTQPVSGAFVGLWRTRLVDSAAAADATQRDANLALTVVEPAMAQRPDPPFGANHTIPLAQADRERLVDETRAQPAQVTRLELSTLGGTLDTATKFADFEWEHNAELGRDMYVRTQAQGAMYPLGNRAELLTVSQRIYDPSAEGAAVLRTVTVLPCSACDTPGRRPCRLPRSVRRLRLESRV